MTIVARQYSSELFRIRIPETTIQTFENLPWEDRLRQREQIVRMYLEMARSLAARLVDSTAAVTYELHIESNVYLVNQKTSL